MQVQLINPEEKARMEKCKESARAAGLSFPEETLEYVISNRAMLEIHPKVMIPTLYDFWIHDVEAISGNIKYDFFPQNPYETVINTMPPISFYNDNNPGWMNKFIFLHVLAHVDFFRNNIHFQNTWDDDFYGRALSDKRVIAALRKEMGEEKRWVDYVIEFSRQLDNLVGFHRELAEKDLIKIKESDRVEFYFGEFSRKLIGEGYMKMKDYIADFDLFNKYEKEFGKKGGEEIFFRDIAKKYLEFGELFEKKKKDQKENSDSEKRTDLLSFLMNGSPFVNQAKNKWIKKVMGIVRDTGLFFSPQIRTKIMNEGWASYWHQELFIKDEMISGNEVAFARVDAGVTQMPRFGLNPYALGLRLYQFMEDMANKGRFDISYQNLKNVEKRRKFDLKTGKGREYIFSIRKNMDDKLFINHLSDKDFEDFVKTNNLFVTGQRFVMDKKNYRIKRQYYVKSRKGTDYRKMLLKFLYHPPAIEIDKEKFENGELYLSHKFEGRSLVTQMIPDVLLGLSYLWGGTKSGKVQGKVSLETTEFELPKKSREEFQNAGDDDEVEYKELRVVYSMEKGSMKRNTINIEEKKKKRGDF